MLLNQCKNGCLNTENWCIDGRRKLGLGNDEKGKKKKPNVCAKIEKKLRNQGLSALGFADTSGKKDKSKCPTLCTADSECEKNKECVSDVTFLVFEFIFLLTFFFLKVRLVCGGQICMRKRRLKE